MENTINPCYWRNLRSGNLVYINNLDIAVKAIN